MFRQMDRNWCERTNMCGQ